LGLTSTIAEFVAGCRFDAIPESAVRTVKVGFADTIGVIIAGSNETCAKVVADFADGHAAHRSSPLMRAAAAPAPLAALIFATAGHAQDYDDTGLNGHPSVVIAPAILAECRETAADGRAMMAAYVAGYETWAELCLRDPDPQHDMGIHPTATFGAVAAAAASANLRRLDATATAHALGIAASMASGIVANFGSMTKPFHVGHAARCGLEAARLAGLGLTAADDALENPRGFLMAMSSKGRVDLESPPLIGSAWRIAERGLNVKLYPMCYALHRIIDGVIELRKRHPSAFEEVQQIDVTISDTPAAILNNPAPKDALEAKFSIQFAVAAAAITGGCGTTELEDAFIRRPDVQNLMKKVVIHPDPEKIPDDPIFSPADFVTVTKTRSERFESGPVSRAYGHHEKPATAEQIWKKFSDCVAPTLGDDEANKLFATVMSLETVRDGKTLFALRAPEVS
jgi:2-methylcitrate dehydratase PrpD